MSTVIIRSLNPDVIKAPLGPLNGDPRVLKVNPLIGVSMRWASKLPGRIVTNEEILPMLRLSEEELMATSAKWPEKRAGAVIRHWDDPGQDPIDYLGQACDRLAALTGKSLGQYGIGIDTNVTSRRWPNNVSLLAERRGITSGLATGEVGSACGTYPFGLWTGINLVISGLHSEVLLTTCEPMVQATDMTDRSTAFLFGNGYGATAILPVVPEKSMLWYADMDALTEVNPHITSIVVPSLANHPEPEIARGVHRVAMNGKEVQNFVQLRLPAYIAKALELTGLTAEDFAGVIPHQANAEMIKTFFFGDYPKVQNLNRRGIKFREDQVIINFGRVGNTTSASLILGLIELWCRVLINPSARRLKAGDKIMLFAFGGGGVVFIIIIEWPEDYPEPEDVPWAREAVRELFPYGCDSVTN